MKTEEKMTTGQIVKTVILSIITVCGLFIGAMVIAGILAVATCSVANAQITVKQVNDVKLKPITSAFNSSEIWVDEADTTFYLVVKSTNQFEHTIANISLGKKNEAIKSLNALKSIISVDNKNNLYELGNGWEMMGNGSVVKSPDNSVEHAAGIYYIIPYYLNGFIKKVSNY